MITLPRFGIPMLDYFFLELLLVNLYSSLLFFGRLFSSLGSQHPYVSVYLDWCLLSAAQPNKVYIGGLPEHTRQEDLQTCFGEIGAIVNIELKYVHPCVISTLSESLYQSWIWLRSM
jgi:hypothetical protein